MDYFKPGIFSVLAEMKQERINAGKDLVDLSVGTPNIPPAQHIMDALTESAGDKKNYIYAISDTADLQNAVSAWYQRRYGVKIDPQTEVTSLLGSQEGLSHIALRSSTRVILRWCRTQGIRFSAMGRCLPEHSST